MKYNISLSKMYNPDDFYDQLEKYIDVPLYFGRNLEELRDVFKLINENTEIIFTDTAEAEVMMSKYVKNLKKVCKEACLDNEKLSIVFD